MANIINIPASVISMAEQAFDDLFDIFGITIKLVYQPNFESCSCAGDTIGKKGTNNWLDGGPSKIGNPSAGICPYCEGSGKIAIERSDTITVIPDWDINSYVNIEGVNIRIRQSGTVVKTKFFLADLSKVLRCEYAMIPPSANLDAIKFKLDSDPIDGHKIIKGKYRMCYWKRMVG